MKSIMVTGATGFIGSALTEQVITRTNNKILGLVRRKSAVLPKGVQAIYSDVLDDPFRCAGRDTTEVVIHLAARAHLLHDDVADPLSEYRKVNVSATLDLANNAAKAGVKRFIYISSIGVNGNINTSPFSESDIPDPVEPYAISKLEAEIGLQEIAKLTDMEVVIIRPPLVYGPNAPGNFGRLLRWVSRGVPLPLRGIHNKRTLIALDNLIDFIITCIDHPAAANQVFLVGDAEDLSTTQLLQSVAKHMNKTSRLIFIPEYLLYFAATLLGKKDVAKRLLGSLQVDISKARELLGWVPPISVDEGLKKAVEGYSSRS